MLSIMELSHMSYHLFFIYLKEIVSPFVLTSGELSGTLNEWVVFGILSKADTSIIKVILPNWT